MDGNKNEMLKSLDYLENKLKRCKDQVESAVLNDKIKTLKQQIETLSLINSEVKVKPVIDQPVIADRSKNNTLTLTRGQVLDTESVTAIIM